MPIATIELERIGTDSIQCENLLQDVFSKNGYCLRFLLHVDVVLTVGCAAVRMLLHAAIGIGRGCSTGTWLRVAAR